MSMPRLVLPLCFLLLRFAAGCSDRATLADTETDAGIATAAPVVAATEPPATVPASADPASDEPERIPDVGVKHL